MTKTTNERMLKNGIIASHLRHYFGPILRAESSMTFYPDGSVQVRGGGQTHDLTRQQVEDIAGVK